MKADKKTLDKIKELVNNPASQAIDLSTNQPASQQGNTLTNYFLEHTLLKTGHVIKAGPLEHQIDRDTYMVFADDQPNHNWSHPCRYLLIDAQGANIYKTINAEFPPYFSNPSKTYHSLSIQVPPPSNPYDYVVAETIIGSPPFPVYTGGERYAVLYSGVTEIFHLNDMEYIYRILIHTYGFNPDNIFVLNFDGTYFKGTSIPNYSCYDAISTSQNWPGDNTPYRLKIYGDGTKETLLRIFDVLKGKLKKDDLLFIHTTGWGTLLMVNGKQESGIVTYPINPVHTCSVSDFIRKLNKLPKFAELVVLMEQCHSGGFKDQVLKMSPADQTCFISSVQQGQKSRQGVDYDPFSFIWFKTMNGYQTNNESGQPKFINCSVINAYKNAPEFMTLVNVNSEINTPVMGTNPVDNFKDIYLGYPVNNSPNKP